MRAQLQTSGGLFLRRPDPPITIEVDALVEADRREFARLVREARFFELPANVPAHRGAYAQTYWITIEDGDREHTVSVSDPVTGPALQKARTFSASSAHVPRPYVEMTTMESRDWTCRSDTCVEGRLPPSTCH